MEWYTGGAVSVLETPYFSFIGQGIGENSKETLALNLLLDLIIRFKYSGYYHSKNGALFPSWTRIPDAVTCHWQGAF